MSYPAASNRHGRGLTPTPPGAVSRHTLRRRLTAALLCFIALYTGALSAGSGESAGNETYRIQYQATLDPSTGLAHVSINLQQPRRLVRSVKFTMPEERYRNVRASGSSMQREGTYVTWTPGKKGGRLKFEFVIDHQRDNGEQDARITDKWALLKLDHLFPRAVARYVKGAQGEVTLKLEAPAGWSIETPYGKGAGEEFIVEDPRRRFDKPLGWMMAGDLAIRRDWYGEHEIAVASPGGSNLHANEIVAFVRWNMPELVALFPDFPQKILIVSGSRDMWRGGLSGVNSLYQHADRPMISGNRTSTLLHELFHVASRMYGSGGADWIVEGLAEYYSLTLLHRSGGISPLRYDEAFDDLAQWSKNTRCVATKRSQGEQTARAALVMRALDAEIRDATGDKHSLDNVVQQLLAAGGTVSNNSFREAAEKLIGGPSQALAACP